MWINPPPTVTQFRTQLLLCQAVIDAGFVEEDAHYPSFASGNVENPDSLPAILLSETPQARERYAEGAIPLISGTLSAKFYLPESLAANAGWVESFVRLVVYQLGAQYYGFAWKSFQVTLSSEPTPAQMANENEAVNSSYRMATITAQYGLGRG